MNRLLATWSTAAEIVRTQGVAVIRNAYPAGMAQLIANYLYEAIDRGQGDPRGHFSIDVRTSELLLRPALHIATFPTLREILGVPQVRLHMPPMARFVRPGNGKAAVPPHQDVAYNRHLGRFVVAWVPVVAIDLRCGGMAVYPQSHMLGELPLEPRQVQNGEWLPAIHGASALLDCTALAPLSPGDVVLLDDHVVHESMPNLSPRTRLSLDYRFFGEVTATTRNYLDVG